MNAHARFAEDQSLESSKLQLLLRTMLGGLGIGAICIGAMFIFMGAHQTATIFSDLFSFVGSTSDAMSSFNDVNIDNELRFYAVFWFAYGIQISRYAWFFS